MSASGRGAVHDTTYRTGIVAFGASTNEGVRVNVVARFDNLAAAFADAGLDDGDEVIASSSSRNVRS